MNRRDFLQRLASLTGAVVLVPSIHACGGAQDTDAPTSMPSTSMLAPPPAAKPADWDAIAYNLARGNAGAIPDTYLA
ncbi:MAG: twin-arginine translocation signal domain-containing protein, partial [Myxococcales bacterium]|nr:twin-arginine translocation signal domain-containing protein [Myxococcales bacterium]